MPLLYPVGFRYVLLESSGVVCCFFQALGAKPDLPPGRPDVHAAQTDRSPASLYMVTAQHEHERATR